MEKGGARIMVGRTAVLAFLPLAAMAQTAPLVRAISTTATQAILSYTAPDASPCTIAVSENQNLAPLVHDVDPALFSGASSDSRDGSITVGTQRTVVIGKRAVEKALDGKRYSRALQAFTQHYYAITCGGTTATGTFQTVNPPLGNLSVDVPGFDATAFGNYAWPTIDWTNSDVPYIDAFTGLLTKRVSFPGAAAVTAGSPYPNAVGVQDGSTFYSAGSSCAGAKWTNPCAALAPDSKYATYSGAGGDPLEVSFIKFGNYQEGGFSNAQGGLTNFQVNLTGFGSDASAANRQVNLCLSLHVFTGVCDTATVTVTLPQSTAATVSYPVAITGDQFLSGWLDAAHPTPLSILDATQKVVSVSVNGKTVQLTGDPTGRGITFDPLWKSGDHINIPGSAPGCLSNECTIDSVANAQTLTTVQAPAGVSGNATATNFGVILSKTTGTGSISIDTVTNTQTADLGYSNYVSGQSYFFSKNLIPVCVDRGGNPISPCRKAYSAHIPSYAMNAWILFFPDTGEARFVDSLRPPNQGGQDGYSNVFCPALSAAVDGANAMKSWCTGATPDGASIALVSGTYQFNSSNGCDYRQYSGYFGGENPCVHWVNETPYSTGNDLVTKTRAIWPSYNPRYDGALQFCQMDEGGRYIAFKTVQGFGPQANGADRFGAVLIFDTQAKAMVQKMDSYSTYPARFGQLHGGCGESYLGYNSEFIATYPYLSLRGSAPYVLNVTNIAGRSDLSLDPGFRILAATISGGVTHLTTTPHQLANSSNRQVLISAIRGASLPLVYAKVVDDTHLDLYYDAAYTRGVGDLSTLATVPYPAAGDGIWTGQTFYAQACPGGLAQKWQSMGAVAGAPNCVTLTLASDPVKLLNVDSQATSYIGATPVLKVNVLKGGAGYTNPSCSISGGGGTGATCAAQSSNGAITGVQVTNEGSGYSYPRAVFSQGLVTATAATILAGSSVSAIQVDQGGLYTSPPTVTVWSGPNNGTGATATASLSNSGSVYQLSVTNAGSGYFGPVGCAITGGGGSGATCEVQYLNGSSVGNVILTNGGSGYTSTPTVVFTGSGTGAAASLTMGYPVASVTVTNGGSGYSMPVVNLSGGGSGALATVGLNEELTYYPYPHNAATCGGDGTTPRCWTQPLSLQEGDAFGFGNPPQNPYGEQAVDEKPFAVKVTRNPDGTITAVFARFLGACAQAAPIATDYPQYRHPAIPIVPQMNPSETCWTLNLNYAQSDTNLQNPLPDNYAVNHGDFITPILSGALPGRVENNLAVQQFRFGPLPETIGKPYQYSSAQPPQFAGSAAQFPNGLIQTHPSARQWAAGTTNELRWYLDTRVLSTESGNVTQVFQENSVQVGACSGTTCIYDVSNPYGFDPKRTPLAAWAGRYLMQDVSGPGSLLSAAMPWQYCYAYQTGECVSGGVQGHVYITADKATAGAGQWCGVSYFVNTPCVIPANAALAQDVQPGMDKADASGVYWRPLGRMWRAWNGNLDGFANPRATPDGSWAFVSRPWVEGVHCDWFAVKLPPWPGLDSANRSGFVQVPVTVNPAPGAARVRIRFGYAENGAPSSFYCTTRKEACTTSGAPFAYASETQTDAICATGCTVNIPAIAGRVVYYEIDRLDASGNLVSASPLQTAAIP